jgi:uncharacterized protein (UPF0332 family)
VDHTTKPTYIAAHLERARDALATARDNLAHGHWRGAVNRAYYAVFHAASAVLLWLDIERARHAGVQAAFGEFLIKSGLIEAEFGRIYNRVRQLREMQDYDLQAATLTAEETARLVRDAAHFVTRLERYLYDVGAIA